MNIFKGMTPAMIVLVVVLALLMALVAAVGISAIVTVLPISGEWQSGTLLLLGIISISIGYFVLIRIPANSQHKKPKPTNHNIPDMELYKPVKGTNNILSTIPEPPSNAIANKQDPNSIKNNTHKAFIIALAPFGILARIIRRLRWSVK